MAGSVVVTGASGFIGTHLVPALCNAGWSVRAVVRRTSALHFPDDRLAVTRMVVDDLNDLRGLREAVAGAQALIHLAGRAHVLNEDAEDALAAFRHTNTEGTAAVMNAARDAGVERVIFLSSVGAMAINSRETLTEETPARPVTPYGISKLEAEDIVRNRAGTARQSAAIVRPPLVYGPGMKGNPLRLMRAIARGIPLPVRLAHNRRSIVYVGNLVAAVVALLACHFQRPETFFVKDEP